LMKVGRDRAHFPIVNCGILGHELVYAQSTISEHVTVYTDKLREFTVAFVDLACATPETRRYAHRREDPVVIEQEALESFFNEDKVLQMEHVNH
jgi:hypothetical protein